MKRLMFTEGNLAWRAMMRNDFFASDVALAQVMMNLSGTVIIRVTNPGSEDSTTEHQVVPSILTDNQGRRLVDALLQGGDVTIKGCSNGTSGEFACSEMNANVTVTITPAQALVERVRTLLDGMVTKIEADQPLTDPEKGLLAATALPVYKYLTVSAAFLGSTVQSDVDRYAAIIARDILYTYLNDILGKMVASVRSLDFKADDKVAEFLAGVTEARREIRHFKLDLAQDFDEALEFTRKTRAYEQAVVSRLSPALFRNLVFSSVR